MSSGGRGRGHDAVVQQPRGGVAAAGGGAPNSASSMHHGGSFRKYMEHKELKLAEQFEASALAQAPASRLFAGVSIHVNGLTTPSHAELKQIMALHGGRFETYYHRSRVTHIICNNLPDTKLKQLAHARCGHALPMAAHSLPSYLMMPPPCLTHTRLHHLNPYDVVAGILCQLYVQSGWWQAYTLATCCR